jgi:hypothetical protein
LLRLTQFARTFLDLRNQAAAHVGVLLRQVPAFGVAE